MWWAMQQFPIEKQQWRVVTFELGFPKLVEVKKPWTIGEGRGGKIK
jgi:hypothetical protein